MKVSGHLHALAALPPGNEPLVPTGQESRWDPEPVWKRYQKEKFPAPAVNRTPIVQLVTGRYPGSPLYYCISVTNKQTSKHESKGFWTSPTS